MSDRFISKYYIMENYSSCSLWLKKWQTLTRVLESLVKELKGEIKFWNVQIYYVYDFFILSYNLYNKYFFLIP